MKRRSVSCKPDKFPAENVFERWTSEHLRPHAEFEQCHFIGGDFASATLGNKRFVDCLFERCNLSLASLAGTGLQNVAFQDCKLSGLQFTACRDMLFEVHFDRCQLSYASFYGKRMPGTHFGHCNLTDADFTGADLANADFQECTLNGAVFHQTQLSGADFRTATGFIIDPDINPLKKARFVLEGLPGLVNKYGVIIGQ
ncbi:pentapeptide repeat-containing protein [Hymenobacter sp. BT491]|uniref:pentapeptide repeat-containing protein n=1 Tax=Hymenobacter sp. BT491 TaxID=2766779 RepID=UPI0016539200|nr:pentapeptide repeat-containing protein [Hymenobacter sp. BT491]MBC6988492.1 pentapeptide repeat-containing protein [Hymenobacter sp. BT491]